MKIIKSFFFGIFGALGALILEVAALVLLTPISSTSETIFRKITSPDYLFFIIIAIEELFKYILIAKAVSKISEKKNIVINSLFLGAGFSILELFSFYLNYRYGINFDPLAALGIIIIHISTAIVIGYAVFKNAKTSLFFGLFVSFAIHCAYNVLGASQHPYQKQLILILLGLLLLLDSFLLIKSKILKNKEER